MGFESLLRKHCRIIVTVAVTIVAILGRNYISYFSLVQDVNVNKSVHIFSQEQLKEYNGIVKNKLHLAVIGTVFDVTEGAKHYEKGAPYHYFVGKDGSRAFVTGEFNNESEDKDNILDLACNDLSVILDWRKTFREKYTSVGLLAGRYYDKYGRETEYMKLLKDRLLQCRQEKEKAKKEALVYPSCNISWSKDDGTRVWCTISSGGIIRNWVGVPRQLYSPGEEKPRCVCVQLHKANSSQLKKYDDCLDTSEECVIKEAT